MVLLIVCACVRAHRNAAGRHSPHVKTGSVSSWACDRMGTSDTLQNKTAEQLGTEAVVEQDKTKCRCTTPSSRLKHRRAAIAPLNVSGHSSGRCVGLQICVLHTAAVFNHPVEVK